MYRALLIMSVVLFFGPFAILFFNTGDNGPSNLMLTLIFWSIFSGFVFSTIFGYLLARENVARKLKKAVLEKASVDLDVYRNSGKICKVALKGFSNSLISPFFVRLVVMLIVSVFVSLFFKTSFFINILLVISFNSQIELFWSSASGLNIEVGPVSINVINENVLVEVESIIIS